MNGYNSVYGSILDVQTDRKETDRPTIAIEARIANELEVWPYLPTDRPWLFWPDPLQPVIELESLLMRIVESPVT